MNNKKLIISCLFFIIGGISATAQNLQLHFDPRHSLYGNDAAPVNFMTATFEMYKPDKWGSTFMFADFDFSYNDRNLGLVYTEIVRDFKIKGFPLMPHIEYNGGLGLARDTQFGFPIENAYLAGFSYPFQLGKFYMGTYLAYKLNAFKKKSHDVQWTVTWTANLANNKLSLSGFVDLWSENKDRTGDSGKSGKKAVLLGEPQIWYNVTPNFSIGSETELSYNFVKAQEQNRFFAIPTMAVKWNF